MNKFQTLYQKVLSGEACCCLETQEGTGCDFGCPYAGIDNCERVLEFDEIRLRSVMKKLDELNGEDECANAQFRGDLTHNTNTIYTHDEAADLVDIFEGVLTKYGIRVPSPEDDEREEDNMIGLYGTTYGDLLAEIESTLIDILEKKNGNTKIVIDTFSGTR